MNLKDVEEISLLIDNIDFLSDHIPNVIKNWKLLIKQCNDIIDPTKIIKEICKNENPKSFIFNPLINWLKKWISLRKKEHNIVLTKKSIDIFLMQGLDLIYKFVVFSNFLIKNIDFFVPYNDGSYEVIKKVIKERNEYEEFIILINKKLIGCVDNLTFKIIPLIETTTIKKSDETIKKINYLKDTCLEMRRLELNTKPIF